MQVEPIIWMLQIAGLGIPGKNLFQDFMPSSVETGILILSPLGGNKIDWELGSAYRRDDTFQIISRAPNRQIAYNQAAPIVRALTITSEITVPATTSTPPILFKYIRPTQDPIVYPRQVDQLWECSLNFETTYVFNNSLGDFEEYTGNLQGLFDSLGNQIFTTNENIYTGLPDRTSSM